MENDNFETLALPHMSFIFKSAIKLSKNRCSAEDLTQETFVIAMQKFNQLRIPGKCRSWLFSIMKNLFLNQLDKNKGMVFLDFDNIAYKMQNVGLPYDKLTYYGFCDQVQHSLDRLEEKYKTPLMLFVIEGLTYKEIATSLEIPIGTVMSRIARAKKFLRREITKNDKAIGQDLQRFIKASAPSEIC